MSENPQIVRYGAVGTLGEPGVLSALTGVPQENIRGFLLPNHGLRIQRLEAVRPDFVRNDLRSGWDDRGIPFYGATTLVPAAGEHLALHVVEIPSEDWNRVVSRRLQFWNYHPDWFNFRDLTVSSAAGSFTCRTEVLSPDDVLERLPASHHKYPDYIRFVQAMEEAILTYRRDKEQLLPFGS